jgi:hypothetical protein
VPLPRSVRALAAGATLGLLATAPLAAPLGETGRRAYEAARAADDGALAALEEGEQTLARVRRLAAGGDAAPEGVRALLEEAAAAHQALVGYRRLAQASATDALRLLADVAKLPVAPAIDVVRRDTLEQHALLAAHEAAVMAARARAEAERLRAVLAEARLATAGAAPGRAQGTSPGGRPAGSAAASAARPGGDGEAVVPNLIGARLEAATRELEAAGLRLGAVAGPREGFVVKQSPDGGTSAPRRSVVSVTLSATAATIAPPR